MKPNVRVVPISQLVLDEKNANKGTKRGRELLGESLERYGAGRSDVVDRHDRVIAGNKSVEAARAAGMKSIAVIESDGSSLVAVQRGDLDLNRGKKARELAIADNRVGELDLEWIPKCSPHSTSVSTSSGTKTNSICCSKTVAVANSQRRNRSSIRPPS